jgi:MinD superfamily P-loop ATPase
MVKTGGWSMKELLVLSGKGGAGKTSIAASFAVLADNCVIVDCDVDAADMHLLLVPESSTEEDFFSGWEPEFAPDKCVACGLCVKLCRYQALRVEDGKLECDPLACEGCGVCTDNCPVDAGVMQKRFCGKIYETETRHGPMIRAKLDTGGENSGKLVSEVRRKAKAIAASGDYKYIISDGPPGIGCPVISSLSGVDKVLLVAEPTVSGFHDLERINQLCKHFQVPIGICVNKHDLNLEMSTKIKEYAINQDAQWLGCIPYDKMVTKAQLTAQPVVELSDSDAADSIKIIWERFKND